MLPGKKFNRDRFMQLGKAEASEVAFKINEAIQEVRPEAGLMGLALNLRTMAELCNIDISEVLAAAARCQHDIDTHADEKRRADRMFKSWYAKDFDNDAAAGELIVGRE